jgi:hypothetical protein
VADTAFCTSSWSAWVRPGQNEARLDSHVALAAKLTTEVVDALYRPRRRPLALGGRSRSGKTTLLRDAARRAGREAVWSSAFDLADQLVAAIRGGSYRAYATDLAGDLRPLCVEHVEDLRDKPRTREELRLLLERAALRRPVLLTLTRRRGDAEVVRWLRTWADLRSVD